MKFIHFLELIIFNLLSVITFFRLKLKKINQANYYIFNLHETDYLDSRSKGFKEDLRLNNSLNLVRVYGLRNCFIAYLNIPNIVFYNYLFFRNSFLIHILKSLYIKKLTTIDDYRVINNIYSICKKLNIFIEVYMHGRFSKKISSQKILQKVLFDKYYVWSNYFKKKLIEINNNYKKSAIQIFKNPNLGIVKKKLIIKDINIILIQENNIKDSFIIKIFNQLLKKKYFLFIKLRKEKVPSKALLLFCKKNNIKIFFNEPIRSIFSKENIHVVLATNSTILLEASYYNIFPIMIKNQKNNLIDLLKDRVVFYATNINKINDTIFSVLKKKRELNVIKNKVWN